MLHPWTDGKTSIVAPLEFMTSHDQLLASFRSQITRGLQGRDKEWERSRRLLDASRLGDTLHRLIERVRGSDLPPPVQASLFAALQQGKAERIQDLSGPELKAVTGLPPSKALRALCVYFEVVEPSVSRWPSPSLDGERVSAFLRTHSSPLDLLLAADVPSILDLGSGDLSFAKEVADRYGPEIHRENRTLILHCVDRLHPESKLGGPLHPPAPLIDMLRTRSDVSFRFFSDQDMCEFDRLAEAGKLAPRYAVASCWAPATPTFAYEPTRLSAEVIHHHLRETKGAFRPARYGKEPALEVRHRDRTLLFPPWKFEIRGPLAILDLLARSSHLGLLGAVDSQVFWEILAQLLEDDRYRPQDQPFTSDNLPAIFGTVYERLSALAIGDTLDLSTSAMIRTGLPSVLPAGQGQQTYRFRSVFIRRGAVFPGMPASSTARRFSDMAEETPPWMVILVPDR
jgi:hypothetical protein